MNVLIKMTLSITLFYLISGCDTMTNGIQAEHTAAEISEDISTLSRFINLDPTTIESERWITGDKAGQPTASMLHASPDWWLYAAIQVNEGYSFTSIQKQCEVLYTLDDGREYEGDLKAKLQIKDGLTKTDNLSVYDACFFKSDVLANGAMIFDVDRRLVFLKMFTS